MVKQDILIAKLNPMLRGWANYHRSIVAKETYSKVDHLVWKAIWRWCCRRHSNRRKRFVKEKYFTRTQNRDWIFGTHNKSTW
nr:group II intron maturase-specific domain-containing protein [Gilliamella apicola]